MDMPKTSARALRSGRKFSKRLNAPLSPPKDSRVYWGERGHAARESFKALASVRSRCANKASIKRARGSLIRPCANFVSH